MSRLQLSFRTGPSGPVRKEWTRPGAAAAVRGLDDTRDISDQQRASEQLFADTMFTLVLSSEATSWQGRRFGENYLSGLWRIKK